MKSVVGNQLCVYQTLGRPPKDFPDFVSELTVTTTWRKVA